MTSPAKTMPNKGALRIAQVLSTGPAGKGTIAHALGTLGAHRYKLEDDLSRLVRDGLVTKELTRITAPARPEYRLTPLGAEFAALATPLMRWIDSHRPHIETARQYSRDAKESQRAAALVAER
jgi:DNA-binding HxlR family transcriptional regulator